MAKEYKVGERYYLPVTVERIVEGEFGVTLSYTDGDEGDTALIWNAPDLLLTATEIAENIAGRRCAECSPMYEELKSRNAELEALLKEVMATRDEAIRQNDELIAENEKLKAGADKLKDTLVDRTKDVQHLTEENDKLKAEHDKEKETTKTLHVVLNDGTEIEFRRYTAYDYRTDIKMFVVKDGERFIAGFNRGDKSFNFAYWWTE